MDEYINSREIKRVLETKTCPTHQQHPEVTITPKGLSLTACCESFKEALFEETKRLSAEQAKKAITDQFRDMFR